MPSGEAGISLLQRFAVGVPGALAHEAVAEIAVAAEQLGLRSFWANDTPNGDGLNALAAAAKVTSTIRLGVGVIPVDRKLPSEIAAQVKALGLDPGRLIVGIGSGGARTGALDLVESATLELQQLTAAPVAVGALGPRMVQLAATVADAALLNWLTPRQAATSVQDSRAIATGRNCEMIAYVRAGVIASEKKVRDESERYNSFPQYRRHFESMGVDAFETCVIAETPTTPATLGEFAQVLDEVVLRLVPVEETAKSYIDALSKFAAIVNSD